MPTNDKPEGDSRFRVALAKTVTTWALVAILAIAALIILVAGINAIRFPEKEVSYLRPSRVLETMNGSMPSGFKRMRWIVGTLLFPSPQPSPLGRGRKANAATGTIVSTSPIGPLLSIAIPSAMPAPRQPRHEADITIRELIDEGFEKDKSHPRQRLPILDAESRGKYVLHRSTIDAFVAPMKRPPDVDESTLSLKDLLEDSKLKDYIVNSFLPVAPDATLADAKDLLDKNPQCLDILVTQDGTKNGIVVGWITNVMVLNAATI